MRLKLLFPILLLSPALPLASPAATLPTPPPVLFFSDLISGPATGNSDSTFSTNGGAYVTLYGNYLTSPTVTLNGAACLTIVSQPATWLWYQRMIVQIGPTCTSGNFVVTTGSGTSSPIPFSVVNGHIYYVSTTGNDSSNGSFQSPWATLPNAKLQMADGDITYIENGFQSSAVEGGSSGAVLYLDPASVCASSINVQRAMGAYPGATVTLGDTVTFSGRAVRMSPNGANCKGYTVFGITGRTAGDTAVGVPYGSGASNQNFRLVGSDLSCPNGNAATGCIITNGPLGNVSGAPNQLTFYGNNIHDSGTGQNKLYHAIYHGYSYSIRDAWNLIANVTNLCHGIQVHTGTAGSVIFDVHIHDNVIHDTGCAGILFASTDPSPGLGGAYGGGIEAYNNVIYNTGVTHPGGSNGIYYSEDANPTGGTVEIYNNTLYNCYTSCYLQALWDPTSTILVHLHNNIIVQTNTTYTYIGFGAGNPSTRVYGENNLGFGNSGSIAAECSLCTGSLNADPSFVNLAGADFHLSSASSPASGGGSTVATVPIYSHDGVLRPSPPSVGAYEFAPGSAPVRPNPPTNLTVAVI